jgi:hypothetical protein
MSFFPTLPSSGPSGMSTSQADQEQQALQYVCIPTLRMITRTNTSPQWKGVSESCPFKMVLSGGMGFAMGGLFGLFMSSVRLP